MTDNDAIRTMEEVLKVGTDTINRQKAEIAKLEKVEKYADETIKAQAAEIERLKSDLTLKTYDYEHLLMKCKELQAISSSRKDRLMQTVVKLQTVKSEAIKKFAERLKSLQTGLEISGESLYYVPIGCIDNLVKEMTEVSGNGEV